MPRRSDLPAGLAAMGFCARVVMAARMRIVESSLKFWQDVALAANALIFGAPAMSKLGATVPARRRVRANARRLTGY
jgi:hypothetical protein